jgi:predicted DNA-binding transcriptional regulator YafY
MADEKHEVLLRLRAIELLAYWEGRLVTNRLMNWFGISRQQASSDIKRYLKFHNPNALYHDHRVKAYVPVGDFRPVLTVGHISEYLEFFSGLTHEAISVVFEPDGILAAVQLPDRTVRPEIVREILRACRQKTSLKILYASMNNPTWTERVISPHTLVYTGFRWHVRAYCHHHHDFRDFMVSRIDRTPKPALEAAPDLTTDRYWEEQISFNLIPNPKLSVAQQALVEREFGMPDGRLQITVRKALVHYTLQRYQAAITADEATNALKFPIVLQPTDKTRLAPCLFDTNAWE